jgi:hypothetical protein
MVLRLVVLIFRYPLAGCFAHPERQGEIRPPKTQIILRNWKEPECRHGLMRKGRKPVSEDQRFNPL